MSIFRVAVKKYTLLAGVAVFSVSLAGPSFAGSPFYFVDDAGNSDSLYTNASCDGAENTCVGFAYACGTQFYSSSIQFENGKDTLRYKGRIAIRQNSGNYEVVCVIE